MYDILSHIIITK